MIHVIALIFGIAALITLAVACFIGVVMGKEGHFTKYDR